MYNRDIKKHAKDILQSPNFNMTANHIQHGSMSVQEHCINVAKTSLQIKKILHIKCNKRDLIRGALLHDYFLYDWHKGDPDDSSLHGFSHPKKALKNARKEYKLTKRQEDIIRKHMWPLTIVPPTCREAWIVTAADKYCSLLETLHINRGSGVKHNKGIKNKHIEKD